jgi:Flp pilus assembly protein CpaB
MEMKRASLTAVVTVLLALAAAGGVFLFMGNVRDQAETVETVNVVVSTQDLPAAQELDADRVWCLPDEAVPRTTSSRAW